MPVGPDSHLLLPFHVTGKLPSFPLGLYEGEPAELVADKSAYDVRYLSFVTVKPLPPFR